MADKSPPATERIRVAEVIGALSLATDLGIGVPLEYGLQSTLLAMQLADRLNVDAETAVQTYYACQLFYVGCTANADAAVDLFGGDEALTTYGTPSRFGSRTEMTAGFLRAVAPPGGAPIVRAAQLARRLPKVAKILKHHIAEFCEVARMLTDSLGVSSCVAPLFAYVAERWDGKGVPGRAMGEQIPLAMRIVHVARDAAFQRMIGGAEYAASVVRRRAGGAFDPEVVAAIAGDDVGFRTVNTASSWEQTLVCEPGPHALLESSSIDRALATMGEFADLVSPCFVGHSAGVAMLASNAARRCNLDITEVTTIQRAAYIHDIGRVAVPARVWRQLGPLTPDDWEKVRLHPYQTERIIHRSPSLAVLAQVAGAHHERCDGSGYHRGTAASGLTVSARLLAAADAYQTKIEPRPHREALSPEQAAETLVSEVHAGRLDAIAVRAVVEAAGQPTPRVEARAGLTRRETEVIRLLARGLPTKQIARALGISVKTADNHIQNAYSKMGVSTRAAAAVFAMRQGLLP